MDTISPDFIESRNWLTFPVAPLTPSAPNNQKWVAVLSGIAVFNLPGNVPGTGWKHRRLMIGFSRSEMMQAIFTMAGRKPSADDKVLVFTPEHWVNYASINSIAVKAGQGVNLGFGFAVDTVDASYTRAPDGTRISFEGLDIGVAVYNTEAQLLRVGFQTTLTGWIREITVHGPD